VTPGTGSIADSNPLSVDRSDHMTVGNDSLWLYTAPNLNRTDCDDSVSARVHEKHDDFTDLRDEFRVPGVASIPPWDFDMDSEAVGAHLLDLVPNNDTNQSWKSASNSKEIFDPLPSTRADEPYTDPAALNKLISCRPQDVKVPVQSASYTERTRPVIEALPTALSKEPYIDPAKLAAQISCREIIREKKIVSKPHSERNKPVMEALPSALSKEPYVDPEKMAAEISCRSVVKPNSPARPVKPTVNANSPKKSPSKRRSSSPKRPVKTKAKKGQTASPDIILLAQCPVEGSQPSDDNPKESLLECAELDFAKETDTVTDTATNYIWQNGADQALKIESRRKELLLVDNLDENPELVEEWLALLLAREEIYTRTTAVNPETSESQLTKQKKTTKSARGPLFALSKRAAQSASKATIHFAALAAMKAAKSSRKLGAGVKDEFKRWTTPTPVVREGCVGTLKGAPAWWSEVDSKKKNASKKSNDLKTVSITTPKGRDIASILELEASTFEESPDRPGIDLEGDWNEESILGLHMDSASQSNAANSTPTSSERSTTTSADISQNLQDCNLSNVVGYYAPAEGKLMSTVIPIIDDSPPHSPSRNDLERSPESPQSPAFGKTRMWLHNALSSFSPGKRHQSVVDDPTRTTKDTEIVSMATSSSKGENTIVNTADKLSNASQTTSGGKHRESTPSDNDALKDKLSSGRSEKEQEDTKRKLDFATPEKIVASGGSNDVSNTLKIESADHNQGEKLISGGTKKEKAVISKLIGLMKSHKNSKSEQSQAAGVVAHTETVTDNQIGVDTEKSCESRPVKADSIVSQLVRTTEQSLKKTGQSPPQETPKAAALFSTSKVKKMWSGLFKANNSSVDRTRSNSTKHRGTDALHANIAQRKDLHTIGLDRLQLYEKATSRDSNPVKKLTLCRSSDQDIGFTLRGTAVDTVSKDAAAAGLCVFDKILCVNNCNIYTEEDVRRELDGAKGDIHLVVLPSEAHCTVADV